MSIYVLASFIPSVVLIESNSRNAWLFFAASVLLGLLLPVDKLSLLLYYSFFGYYGILKYHLEGIKGKIPGFVLKLMVFYSAVTVNYYIAGAFLPGYISEEISLAVLMIVATPFFFIYDYLYTLAIIFYMKRIGGKRLKG
ncbi:MAG: hypothetical protein JXB33_07175 [Clostridia bacterium]|nr:hypothetical protein [Clostridia bacterium]